MPSLYESTFYKALGRPAEIYDFVLGEVLILHFAVVKKLLRFDNIRLI